MDNIDWDSEPDEDEDTSALTADDFIFDAKNINSKEVCVMICPNSFFTKNGYCYDQHISDLIDKWLPKYLYEDCECMFVTEEKTVDEVRLDMLKAGFKENKMFTKFLASL